MDVSSSQIAVYCAGNIVTTRMRIEPGTCLSGTRSLECAQRGEHMTKAALLLLIISAVSGALHAQDSDSATKSKIVALEQLWNQAYKAGDTKALDAILDKEIVLVNDDGSVQNKTEFLASVKQSPSQPASQQQQVAPESLNVHLFGTTAIATGVMRVKGVENGKPYVRHERFVDTWVYKGGTWVCVGTDATPVLH